MNKRPNFTDTGSWPGFMHPSNIQIQDYTYSLPEDRIAKQPLSERGDSKLLVWNKGTISESRYNHISQEIPPHAVLVFNNTQVIAARIHFRKEEGGRLEVFLLDPADNSLQIGDSLNLTGTATWKCLIGGASKWKHGYIPKITVSTDGSEMSLEAEITDRLNDSFIVRFRWEPAEKTFSEVLAAIGEIPLPPYLKRPPENADRERYQTIFAQTEGSVAAPTAGLHFTPEIFDSLAQKEIKKLFLTLHVGAGTFRPVKTVTMEGHEMHAEWMETDIQLLKELATNTQPLFAVGTTSLRTLESLFWMGFKCYHQKNISLKNLEISQWEVYDHTDKHLTVSKAMEALQTWMHNQEIEKLYVRTSILIAPGYRFRMIDGLITNFHQPQSTLLLLVAALAGEAWRDIYDYALNNHFRFLSYGDGCLIFNPDQVQS